MNTTTYLVVLFYLQGGSCASVASAFTPRSCRREFKSFHTCWKPNKWNIWKAN